MSFVILESGNVADITVVATTGYEILDQSAVSAIKEAAPFPKPPRRTTINLSVPYKVQ